MVCENAQQMEIQMNSYQPYWLTDKHIDHAQWLLSINNSQNAKGLHSVLAFASKPPKVQKGDKDFV